MVTGQHLTVEPATVCVRRSSFDNRANPGRIPRSSKVFFSHRLRFRSSWIGVIHHQPRNLTHVEVRKNAYVVAAEGDPTKI